MTLAAGADLKSINRYGGTALIPAAHRGHVETVRELLKTRIDVDHVNRLGWTALLEAVMLGDGARAIATGSRHSVAIRTDNSLWAWGEGFGIEPRRLLEEVVAVAAGNTATIALCANGSLWQWDAGAGPRRLRAP